MKLEQTNTGNVAANQRNKADDRFKMGGPPPGIQVSYGSMELDPHGQPLSPTNMLNPTIQLSTQDHQAKTVADHILNEPEGPPKHTGLTTFEYSTDNQIVPSSLQYFGGTSNVQLLDKEWTDKYLSLMKETKKAFENEASHLMEICVNLPACLLIEQVELKFYHSKEQLFKKYLRLVGVTKRSMIRKESLEHESKITEDIQITVNALSKDQKVKAKYLKLRNGYFDNAKSFYELNFGGNACQQVNFQFEFNKAEALDLIEQCKHVIGQRHTQTNTDKEKSSQNQTHSQLMTSRSYGNDYYFENDASEIDDLDNEVVNIARKFTQKQKDDDQSMGMPSSRTNEIDHEDIRLQLGEHSSVQDQVKILDNDSPTIKPVSGSKVKMEERKLFEGQNMNIWANNLFKRLLQSIKIVGFNTSKLPAITTLSHLMNISFYLSKDKIYHEDILEVNQLLGSLLISSKRNIQAVEVLRNKVQRVYLQQIEHNQLLLQGAKGLILSNDEKDNLKAQLKKLFQRSALIELMCAEAMCIKPQINDKLQALVRMTQLCRGQIVSAIGFNKQIFKSDDEYTTVIKILPFLLKFSLQCLENNPKFNKEIIMVSALRNIHFILETQGCSLDSAMVVILKSLFKNYPNKTKQDKIAKKDREKQFKLVTENELISKVQGIKGTNSLAELQSHFNSQYEMRGIIRYQMHQNSDRDGRKINHQRSETMIVTQKQSMIEQLFQLSWVSARNEPTVRKEPNSGFEKTLTGLFSSILDTYIRVLSSISSHILHQIFYEVIVPVLIQEPFEEDKLRFDSLEKEERELHFEYSSEVKVFAIKIAEKIITICQGDLVISKALLDMLVKSQTAPSHKKQLEMNGAQEQLRQQLKGLWSSIRNKVFTNYQMKGFKQLVDWLVNQMSQLAQNCTILDGKSNISEIAMLELSEDDLMMLSQYLEIIAFISVGRRSHNEEANSLIKIKHDYCMDLYLLLNPLLFWLDFSVEREERLGLFKQVYQTIKDVLDNLPPKKVDIDILQIIIPILQRTSEYLRQNSPTQGMLKFLDLVLKDIQAGNFCQSQYPDLQMFFADMLSSLVDYISYCLYEDIFPVFEKLLSLCCEVLPASTLRKCILSLVDKYTMKSKSQKAASQSFIKLLLDASVAMMAANSKSKKKPQRKEYNEIEDQEIEIRDPAKQRSKSDEPTYFEIMLETCFFLNNDEPAEAAASLLSAEKMSYNQIRKSSKFLETDRNLQFKSPQDLHELYVDRLQFFIDSFTLLEERHLELFTTLLSNPAFKQCVFRLLEQGETNLRLKCHEILEAVGTYFVSHCNSKTVYEIQGSQRSVERMELEFISAERLFLAQMMMQCVRKSFEMNIGSDSYLQFNSLILLDFLFQQVLPVPTFQNDQLKQRQKRDKMQILQRQRAQLQQNQQLTKTDNQYEDGSSGGEGTFTKNRLGLAAEDINQRELNLDYLGDLSDAIDLETLELNANTPEFEVTDCQYAALRLNCVFKLWQYVQDALNSPWSNIRSICYGLICSMLKVNIKNCSKFMAVVNEAGQEIEELDQEALESNKFYQKLRSIVIPMMLNLLSSKESESKAGGLNILGSLCGLSYDFSKVKISRNLDFFKRNSEFVSLPIWQLVFDLQDDWDITIKEASIVLVQLCAPRQAIQFFNKTKVDRENQQLKQMFKKLEKTGGAGQGSVGDLSSARQNSYRKNDGAISSRKGFDWQNYEFQKETDCLKIDIASFLKDQNDLFEIQSRPVTKDKILKSSRDYDTQPIKKSVGDLIHGTKSFQLDLDLIKQGQNESSSLTQRNENNEHILVKQQEQNHHLMLAMQGQSSASKSQLQIAPFDFFVDSYSDEQIQEIISIFRNDFKPPKNLWIEKQDDGAFFNVPDYYADIFSGAIEQFNQQQMMLQMKQNQELQEQVSHSSSVCEPPATTVVVLKDPVPEPEKQIVKVSPDDPKQKEEEAKHTALLSLDDSVDKEIKVEQPPTSQENSQESIVEDVLHTTVSVKKTPATDIKMLEQIDFDAININSDDINQNNQKQSIIQSTDSGSEVVPDCEEIEHPDFIDTDEECVSSPESHSYKIDKFKEMAKIGTNLQVIESNSNEVSVSVESKEPNSIQELVAQPNKKEEARTQEREKKNELQLHYIDSSGISLKSQEGFSNITEFTRKQVNQKTPVDTELVSQEFSIKNQQELKPILSSEVPLKQVKHQAVSPHEQVLASNLAGVKDQNKVSQVTVPYEKERNLSKGPKSGIKGNSNSMPDIQAMTANTRSSDKSNETNQPKIQGKRLKINSYQTTQLESARSNANHNIPLPYQTNSGNFTHRVPSQGIPQAGNIQSGQTNMKMPKNLTSSNQDYQQYHQSSQMIGLQQHTSKQSVKFMLQPELSSMPAKGKTSMDRINIDHDSEKSSQAIMNKNKIKKKIVQNNSRAKSAGKKKTLSISPHSKNQNEISSMISQQHAGPNSLNSQSAQSGANQKLFKQLTNQQLQQFLLSAQAMSNQTVKDNFKDLNHLIKNLEKFNKSNNKESNSNTLGSVSQPQSPNELLKGLLMNWADHNANKQKKKGVSNNVKTLKVSTGATGVQKKLYQQLKEQQSKGMLTAEQIHETIKKGGLNLEQLNQILHKVIHNQKLSKSESGLRKRTGHGSSSSAGKGQQKERRYTGQMLKGSQKQRLHSSEKSNPHSNNSSGEPYRVNMFNHYDQMSADNKYGSHSPNNKFTSGSRKSGLYENTSSRSKDKAKQGKKLKNKHPSLNLVQPPKLNNLLNLNLSQTQRLDLKEINKQFMAYEQAIKQSGSTQNKNTMLINNQSQVSIVPNNFKQKDFTRDKSAKSARNVGAPNSTKAIQPQFQFNTHVPEGKATQYNNLMGQVKNLHTGGKVKEVVVHSARGGSLNQLTLQNNYQSTNQVFNAQLGNLPVSPKNNMELSNSKNSSRRPKMPVSARVKK